MPAVVLGLAPVRGASPSPVDAASPSGLPSYRSMSAVSAGWYLVNLPRLSLCLGCPPPGMGGLRWGCCSFASVGLKRRRIWLPLFAVSDFHLALQDWVLLLLNGVALMVGVVVDGVGVGFSLCFMRSSSSTWLGVSISFPGWGRLRSAALPLLLCSEGSCATVFLLACSTKCWRVVVFFWAEFR